MPYVVVNAELEGIDEVLQKWQELGEGKLPRTAQAVNMATSMAQEVWIRLASTEVKVRTGTYLRSIEEGKIYPFMGDPFTGAVESTAPHAWWIDFGFPAYDMKPGLLASPKAKVSAKGKRYLVVPFRHGAPKKANAAGLTPDTGLDAMPKEIYNLARQLKHNSGSINLKGTEFEKVGWDKKHWKSSKFQHMSRRGQMNHSQYLTFRIVSENSAPESWQHPGVKAKHITDRVAAIIHNDAVALITRGYTLDMQDIGGGNP